MAPNFLEKGLVFIFSNTQFSTIGFFNTRIIVCCRTCAQVNGDSPSDSAGLRPGDVISQINGRDVSGLRHKEAQVYHGRFKKILKLSPDFFPKPDFLNNKNIINVILS